MIEMCYIRSYKPPSAPAFPRTRTETPPLTEVSRFEPSGRFVTFTEICARRPLRSISRNTHSRRFPVYAHHLPCIQVTVMVGIITRGISRVTKLNSVLSTNRPHLKRHEMDPWAK